MEKFISIDEAERKVLGDARELLQYLQMLSGEIHSSDEGVRRLSEIRSKLYENLNQIQHEHLIMKGLQWLGAAGITTSEDEWYWNPRQTGNSKEPDLIAKRGSRTVLCAEVTTSERPQGTIDTHMRDTLEKLSLMDGEKFYFVRTSDMERRANTKIQRNSWQIKVVRIDI